MPFLPEMNKLLINLNKKKMKKITLLFVFLLIAFFAKAQSKGTGVLTLQNNMTADLTLNNTTSKVTLILTGPSDRWFGFGIGVSPGFGMSAGDVLVYTTSTTPALKDRGYGGTGNPPQDVSQDWTINSDIVAGSIRTLNLTRDLTNADTSGQDFQMPYSTTNSFSVVGVRAGSPTFTVGSHGGSASAGYATATFSTLAIDDFSLNASSVYPNPSNGNFTVTTKTALSEINIYSQTGAFVKTIKVDKIESTEVSVAGLQTGIYLLELKNDTEKTWKKVVIE